MEKKNKKNQKQSNSWICNNLKMKIMNHSVFRKAPLALFKSVTLEAIWQSQTLLDRSLSHLLLQMRNERLFDVTGSCLDSTITLIPCLALYLIWPSTPQIFQPFNFENFCEFHWSWAQFAEYYTLHFPNYIIIQADL